MPKKKEPEKELKPNSPTIVRSSFLTYLRSGFPYELDWTHPHTGKVFKHELIMQRLTEYRKMDARGYRALWYLWTTQGTRCFIADRLNCSGTTLKRLWDRCIDILMSMLLFPDLVPECFAIEEL